jgi:large exoprotein involved in heme utilization and adhesion
VWEVDLQTTGGNITIDPQYVILNDSQIIANAYEGTGGNIRIIADVFFGIA